MTHSRAEMPSQASLLCAFANTLDVDLDADPPEALPNPQALTRWLREQDLLPGEEVADDTDLALAVRLRAGVREAMVRHHEGDDSFPVRDLDAAAAHLPLHVTFDGTVPRLRASSAGARGALAHVLVAITEADADGTWGRLKLCRAQDCLLAFYDASKNRSRHWCSMSECGNRQKTRAYRARARGSKATG